MSQDKQVFAVLVAKIAVQETPQEGKIKLSMTTVNLWDFDD